MTDKKINGPMAHSLIEAAEHLAKLNEVMRDIHWRICFRDDMYVHFSVAKAHCRKLLDALNTSERRLIDDMLDETEEKPPTIRQVK